jgi:thiosulfate dehydrogenase [quinone] large subunit
VTTSTSTTHEKFGLPLLRARPLKGLGIGFALLLRYLYGLFFLFATINKIQRNYMFGDYPLQIFTRQLAQIDPDGIMAAYLKGFLIPNYHFVGAMITLLWATVTVGLLLGLCTRWAGALAIFICVNIGLGGFYDASLIALAAIAAIFVVLPTGHWLGLDRRLHQRQPQSILFR